MRNIKIEIKIIFAFIVFTILVAGIDRYTFTSNIEQQFIKSKKSKNQLLMNTILPIVKLNLSLGINKANKEYLQEIVNQNSDIKSMVLRDIHKNNLFNYNHSLDKKIDYNHGDTYSSIKKVLIDNDIGEEIGAIHIEFYDHDYQVMLEQNKRMTSNIIIAIFSLLLLFLFYIKREFRHLRHLSKNVSMYDPKKHNFTLDKSQRIDEVGIVHNAVVDMVERINIYSKELDELNSSLEKKVEKRTEELLDSNEKLKHLSITDTLTKLYNRMKLEETLNEQLRLANRYKTPFGVIIIDIDYFKEVNDTYGHQAGDQVLFEIANILQAKTRETDIVGRWGGEEFLIVSPKTDLKGLTQLAKTLRSSIEEYEFKIVKRKTASFGVTQYKLDENIDAMIDRADDALYKAKKAGRNKVVHA